MSRCISKLAAFGAALFLFSSGTCLAVDARSADDRAAARQDAAALRGAGVVRVQIHAVGDLAPDAMRQIAVSYSFDGRRLRASALGDGSYAIRASGAEAIIYIQHPVLGTTRTSVSLPRNGEAALSVDYDGRTAMPTLEGVGWVRIEVRLPADTSPSSMDQLSVSYSYGADYKPAMSLGAGRYAVPARGDLAALRIAHPSLGMATTRLALVATARSQGLVVAFDGQRATVLDQPFTAVRPDVSAERGREDNSTSSLKAVDQPASAGPGKVTICHKGKKTKSVSIKALPAHLAHGDSIGPCGTETCPGEGSCCDAHPTPGCEDATCCGAVCAAMPECCTGEWTDACAAAAETTAECADLCEPTGGTCGAGAGDCCVADGTPGCDDVTCCEAICETMPDCCDVAWTDECAEAAVDTDECSGLCEPVGACGPGAGGCCVADGTPGCDEIDCCLAVCAIDPFCCDVAWDSICVSEAEVEPACSCEPAEACGPGSGDCCVADGTPGCDDVDCCESVCALDPFCCDVAWDSICLSEAEADPACECEAGAECGPGAGDCCVADGTVGCDDVDCCESVCALDAFCCDVSWDSICVSEAEADPLCDEGACVGGGGSPCGPGAGDCCVADGTVGCDDVDCCESVCALDAFCCDVSWDSICVSEAEADPLCDEGACVGGGGGPCGPGAGDCCVADGTVGCDDVDCCESVCALDGFCCDVSWDSICVSEAEADPLCDEGSCS